MRSPGCLPSSRGLFQSGHAQAERLEENIGAAAVELTSADLREIESAASRITIQGARYPEHLEKRTGL